MVTTLGWMGREGWGRGMHWEELDPSHQTTPTGTPSDMLHFPVLSLWPSAHTKPLLCEFPYLFNQQTVGLCPVLGTGTRWNSEGSWLQEVGRWRTTHGEERASYLWRMMGFRRVTSARVGSCFLPAQPEVTSLRHRHNFCGPHDRHGLSSPASAPITA